MRFDDNEESLLQATLNLSVQDCYDITCECDSWMELKKRTPWVSQRTWTLNVCVVVLEYNPFFSMLEIYPRTAKRLSGHIVRTYCLKPFCILRKQTLFKSKSVIFCKLVYGKHVAILTCRQWTVCLHLEVTQGACSLKIIALLSAVWVLIGHKSVDVEKPCGRNQCNQS